MTCFFLSMDLQITYIYVRDISHRIRQFEYFRRWKKTKRKGRTQCAPFIPCKPSCLMSAPCTIHASVCILHRPWIPFYPCVKALTLSPLNRISCFGSNHILWLSPVASCIFLFLIEYKLFTLILILDSIHPISSRCLIPKRVLYPSWNQNSLLPASIWPVLQSMQSI